MLASFATAALLAGCGQGEQKAASAPPPPAVTVAPPVTKTVTDHDEYVGRFTAVNSVEVRARVSGYLDSVDFKDGQIVKKGDLLFTVDKRPFQNAVDQARAALAQAKSNLRYAQADLQRGQSLVNEKTISQQVFEQRAQAARNAQAAVTGAEAALKQAELDLQFTELRAPMDGRIGDRRVSPGNLVTGGTSGNTTLLATIVSTNPIYFEFTFDEASFLRYERLGKSAHDIASRGAGVPVALELIDENDFPHHGRMDFVDNVIDRSTGTIRGRAVFQNPNGIFTPGMFARVRVPASSPYEALLVPDVAIGSEQARKYVLVVDQESVAREKYVTLGQLVGKLRVIKSGLEPQDRVVVDGIARVRAGQKVKAEEEHPPSNKPVAAVKSPSAAKAD
ncbi:MAG TPA: efflux RND transporter periplasmic adaptor subunit [Pseudolabrys sp.]|nr:efflux RND transporter periplasmic adaptor subunit [Pseudolabrys sp.]